MRLFSKPRSPPVQFTPGRIIENTQEALSVATSFVLQPMIEKATSDEARLRYLLSMGLRMSWFAGQHLFVQSFLIKDNRFLRSLHFDTVFEELMGRVDDEATSQMIYERNTFLSDLFQLLQQDMNNVAEGYYKMPLELQPAHAAKQLDISKGLKKIAHFHADAQLSNIRREKENGIEVRIQFPDAIEDYPEYYLQNFHYQTDGWLSSESAELYDYQVESLFCGGADLMRRQLMTPLLQFCKERQGQLLREQRSFQHLDLACGTGRLASALLENDPSIDCTLSDLSPFYLDEAKKQLELRHPHAKYVPAAAEALPFDDCSFDSISCVYLFHELPQEVRVKALQEIRRVLRPGGKLFFMDSVQQHDVPYKQVLEDFDFYFHEPYYREYTTIDLPAMLAEAGLKVESERLHWISKSIVASSV